VHLISPLHVESYECAGVQSTPLKDRAPELHHYEAAGWGDSHACSSATFREATLGNLFQSSSPSLLRLSPSFNSSSPSLPSCMPPPLLLLLALLLQYIVMVRLYTPRCVKDGAASASKRFKMAPRTDLIIGPFLQPFLIHFPFEPVPNGPSRYRT